MIANNMINHQFSIFDGKTMAYGAFRCDIYFSSKIFRTSWRLASLT